MLASLYFELGEHEKALHYASLALEREPSSVTGQRSSCESACGYRGLHVRAVTVRSSRRPQSRAASDAARSAVRFRPILRCITSSNSTTFSPAIVMSRAPPAFPLRNFSSVRRELAEIIDGTQGVGPVDIRRRRRE